MRPQHFPGGMFWFWQLGMMALLLVGVVLLVLWLLKRRQAGPAGFTPPPWQPGHHPGHHAGGPAAPPMPPQPGDALRILDERLARGDIDVDDYLTRRAALTGDRPNGTVFSPSPDPGQGSTGEDAPPAG